MVISFGEAAASPFLLPVDGLVFYPFIITAKIQRATSTDDTTSVGGDMVTLYRHARDSDAADGALIRGHERNGHIRLPG